MRLHSNCWLGLSSSESLGGWRTHFHPHSPDWQAPFLISYWLDPQFLLMWPFPQDAWVSWQRGRWLPPEWERKRVQDESHRAVFLNNPSVEVIYHHRCCVLLSTWIHPGTRKWDYPSSHEFLRAILVTGALAHLPHHLLLEYVEKFWDSQTSHFSC